MLQHLSAIKISDTHFSASYQPAGLVLVLLTALIGLLPGAAQADPPRVHPVYPEYGIEIPQRHATRDANDPMGHLSADLRLLYRFYASRTDSSTNKTRQEASRQTKKDTKYEVNDDVNATLRERYGIVAHARNPMLELLLTLNAPADIPLLQPQLSKFGGTLLYTAGDMAYIAMPVLHLFDLAKLPSTLNIAPIPASRIPILAHDAHLITQGGGGKTRGEEGTPILNGHMPTGKGVLIADVGTGVDWRHRDFIRPDGSSRVIMLWDMYDDSWEKSGGKIGTKPLKCIPGTNRPLGTIYTGQQITEALNGKGTVHSWDSSGHGTACLGVAAGNDKAYPGVATEADLLAVNIFPHNPFQRQGHFAYLGVKWVVTIAKSLHRPLVVNLSFGNQANPHNGQATEEQLLNKIVKDSEPGVVVCASAGNEGRDTIHASDQFGPHQPGEMDIRSNQLELFVTGTATISSYFYHDDDWGLAITNLDLKDKKGLPIKDTAGMPISLEVVRNENRVKYYLSRKPKDTPQNLDALIGIMKVVVESEIPMKSDLQTDSLAITLPPGHYMLQGFSTSDKVANGRFDLYAMEPKLAKFASGASFECMVSSPANADSVIAVGSYDFRSTWSNVIGTRTRYQMNRGAVSTYSNPGYRRDGSIKPDILCPGRFAISALAKGSAMARNSGNSYILHDGIHIAWDGTSAASAYAAGVVALMLQKNPTLNTVQVRDILTRTAMNDPFTGSTPNIHCGYGKLNLNAALQETPAP